MASVYFSHSYRPPDQSINKYFLDLLQGRGLMPSVDVPSNRLNSAKNERQLSFTRGLISIVPLREDGAAKQAPLSPYIRYEILMAVRSGKPVLVFAEDTLPNGLFPHQVMEERFSRKSFWRDAREHLQAIDSFHAFVGKSPSPRVRISSARRYVVTIGFSRLDQKYASMLSDVIRSMNYDMSDFSVLPGDPALVDSCHAVVRGANLVVAFVENMDAPSAYLLGIARSSATPTISLQFTDNTRYLPGFPPEHGPRILPERDARVAAEILRSEIEIFEDEAIEIDRQDEIARYIEFLKDASSRPGVYDSQHRTIFIQQLNQFQDLYNVAKAGAVGNQATHTESEKK